MVGVSNGHDGVQGISHSGDHTGVVGINDGGGKGVFGSSNGGDGVQGMSHDKNHAGVAGINDGGGIGIFGSGQVAGRFNGDVEIAGNLTMSNGGDVLLADFAENFDLSGQEEAGPGSVVVLTGTGAALESQTAYDKRVAGVVSGAGNFRPAITLDRRQATGNRTPVALMGKVYCKVDANYAPIEVGDLLTTSPTRGHAMKAGEPLKAFGSVIGKALRPMAAGQGLIPILVALQ